MNSILLDKENMTESIRILNKLYFRKKICIQIFQKISLYTKLSDQQKLKDLVKLKEMEKLQKNQKLAYLVECVGLCRILY